MKIVVDTNIVLRGKWLEDLPWNVILGANPNEILIPNKVLQEIDEKKHDPKHHERARKRSRSLYNLISQKTKSKKTIRYNVLKINASQTEFEAGLNPNLFDDCILNEIITYKKETDEKITLLTSDISLSLRAPSYSIKTILLDSKYLLKGDDPKSQEIKKLKYKIVKLENRMPNLEVCFENKKNTQVVLFNYKKKLDTDKKVKKYRDDLIKKCPHLTLPEKIETVIERVDKVTSPKKIVIPALSAIQLAEERKAKYERYNMERESYIERIEQHIKQMKEYDEIHSRSFEFELLIHNNGTCAASLVSVYLHFPNGFKLIDLDSNEFNEIECQPGPPVVPKHPSVSILASSLNNLSSFNFPVDLFHKTKNTRPFIEKTNSYSFEYPPIEEIVHYNYFSLGRFKIFFDSQKTIKSFHVECKIHCKEFLGPKNQQLHFKIKKPVSASK